MIDSGMPEWLSVQRAEMPLLVSLPHSGTTIPSAIQARLGSPWLGLRDTDWWTETLYDFAGDLGATVVRTAISRTVIDVNRNPDGIVLYPGRANTELCPTTTFDGETLYRGGGEPAVDEIEGRTERYFAPYHKALADELARLRRNHACVVLYDAHSIRSLVPRLFAGVLPALNLGSNDGATCSAVLLRSVEKVAQDSGLTQVTDGRFKGGYITRHYGCPEAGIHALQMEVAMRSYLREPTDPPSPVNWPPPYDPSYAAALRQTLTGILRACLHFANSST